MITTRVLDPTRIRTPEGSFAFVPHRFLRGGFWEACSLEELVVYFFLVLAADRDGVSFYGRKKTAALCRMSLERIEKVHASLVERDLIAGDGALTQVLSLPEAPAPVRIEPDRRQSEGHGPISVAEAIHNFTLTLRGRT